MRVRVKSGKHYRNEDGQTARYEEGEVFDATEAELAGFPERFEVVGDAAPREESRATIDPGSDAGENPGEMAEMAATIDSGDKKAEEPDNLATEEPTSGLRAQLPAEIAVALEKAGIDTMEKLAEIAGDPDALAKVKGIGKTKAKQIRELLMKAES